MKKMEDGIGGNIAISLDFTKQFTNSKGAVSPMQPPNNSKLTDSKDNQTSENID